MTAELSACAWCGGTTTDPAALSCFRCGAPLGASHAPDAAGWTELPPIADGTRIQAGNTRIQIEGLYTPMVEVALGAGDGLLFTHNVLLWQDPDTELRNHPMAGAFRRMRAGLPIVMMEAHGPGRLGLSHDSSGEVVALPIDPGRPVVVKEHHLVAATLGTAYDAFPSPVSYIVGSGDDTEYEYPIGYYLDSFRADTVPGLVLLHAMGNAFTRVLAPGERIVLNPAAYVMSDASVQLTLAMEVPAGDWGALALLRLIGPGRVLIQSGSHGHLHRPRMSRVRWGPEMVVQRW
jgi:uncharacterized protein (AIM24 family)